MESNSPPPLLTPQADAAPSTPGAIPPPLTADAVTVAPVAEASVPRWRWWVHLVILTLFITLTGLSGFLKAPHAKGPALPTTVKGLLYVSWTELCLFALVLGFALYSSRATREQLLLKWQKGIFPVLWGFLYSIGLRVGVTFLIIPIVLLSKLVTNGKTEDLVPHIEHTLDPKALGSTPLYLILMLTLVSFVVAGLREELWRTGMLAGLKALFPWLFENRMRQMIAVCIVAIFFGFGHLSQGLMGVAMTTALGVGLGAILVFHGSIWPAVIAHGFFDATSFFLLYVIAKYFRPLLEQMFHQM